MNDKKESPFKGTIGFRRIFNATSYSIAGLKAAWIHEAAFRQVCLMSLIGLAIAIYLPFGNLQRTLIFMVHLGSVVVELLNSAVEAAVDHTSLVQHPLAKRAKDMGSAAQLICLITIAIVWGFALLG